MTASPEDLFAYLDALGIAHHTHWHDAVFTVDEGRDLKAAMPGIHTKNLFLKDKDATFVLISAEAQTRIALNQLHRDIGTKRLSFASPVDMLALLGVTPGSVTRSPIREPPPCPGVISGISWNPPATHAKCMTFLPDAAAIIHCYGTRADRR